MLNKVENGFYFMQRTSSDINEPSKLFRPFPCNAFSKIQHNAIGSPPPLIRQILLGAGQSIDEWTRKGCYTQSMLIGFKIPE